MKDQMPSGTERSKGSEVTEQSGVDVLGRKILDGFCTSNYTITLTQSVKDGDILVSSDETFGLGFFSPVNSSRRYVGIWYNKISERTIVWVANRDSPMNRTSGVLSLNWNGNLVIYDNTRNLNVWQTNITAVSSSARLLDSGTGEYSFRVEPNELPQFILFKGSTRVRQLPGWLAQYTSNAKSEATQLSTFISNGTWVNNRDEVYEFYSLINASNVVTMFVDELRNFKEAMWVGRWVGFFSFPKDICDEYGRCIKKRGTLSMCRNGEGFVKVANAKILDSSKAHVWMSQSMHECKECLRNCSCLAYISEAKGEGTRANCFTWHENLMDVRKFVKRKEEACSAVAKINGSWVWGQELIVKEASFENSSKSLNQKSRDRNGRCAINHSCKSKKQTMVWKPKVVSNVKGYNIQDVVALLQDNVDSSDDGSKVDEPKNEVELNKMEDGWSNLEIVPDSVENLVNSADQIVRMGFDDMADSKVYKINFGGKAKSLGERIEINAVEVGRVEEEEINACLNRGNKLMVAVESVSRSLREQPKL
ncbi:hypothetical protein Vadar_025696 [Vaccinium darrowii]|uniref:Uncharacterized protein n=1 Tax=Vaccinium darrowii TaxID=229202 RepID=A0ACB7YYC9_9ERIC|nr:hypothetical protein Vadar_025696 [Vaccinium darrowii]